MFTWERSCKPVRDINEILELPVKREWLGVCLHHTWEPDIDDYKGEQTVEAIRRYHMSKGWTDIGYHLLIGPDGRLFWGRSWERSGAHAIAKKPTSPVKNPNQTLLGVCIIGNYDVHDLPEAAREALREVLRALSKKFGFGPERIYFHRQFQHKTCPGLRIKLSEVRGLLRGPEAPHLPCADAVVPVLFDGKEIGTGYILENRTYLPVREVCQVAGLKVIWDAKRRAVILSK